MAPDPSAETPSENKPRLKVKSLMVAVALAAVLFGVLAQTARTMREFDETQTRFNTWIAEVEKANPTLKRGGTSFRSSSSLFELNRNCIYTLLSPTRKSITIQANFRAGPFSKVRTVTFETPGKSVSWPFEDIENDRKPDLKAEFPEAFR